WDAAFASAVRTMGAGQDGPRLVVGTPDMASGGVVRQLESVWGALKQAPRTSAALPREIVLAAPLGRDELPALQRFVAEHRVAVSVAGGQRFAEVAGVSSMAGSDSVMEGGAGQWLHITPSAETVGRIAHTAADRPSAVSTATTPTRTSVADPRVGSPTTQQTVFGLRDRYADEDMLFRRYSQDSPGVMGTGAATGPPVLTGAHPREIEDVTAAANVLRDLPALPHAALADSPSAGAGTWARRPAVLSGTSMPQATMRADVGLREAGGSRVVSTVSMVTGRMPAVHFPGPAGAREMAHYIGVVLDPPGSVSAPRGPQPDGPSAVPRADAAGAGLPHAVGPAYRQDVLSTTGKPSAEQASQVLGKLSEERYEKLSARVDRFVKTDVVIGDDAAARRSRSAQEALRDQVIHALHRSGEEAARRLAGDLDVVRTRGLPGGSDHYGSYSPRDDDDLLYRDDSRHPDDVFEEGFRPRSPEAQVSHWSHMWGHTESNWVSTSRRSDLRKVRGYRYEVDVPGAGLDASQAYGDDYPWVFRPEQEVAFEGGIDRSQILGAGEEERTPAGLASLGAGDGSDSFYLVNPNYRFPPVTNEHSWPTPGSGSSTPAEWHESYSDHPSYSYRSDEDDDYHDA
ncbi:hypothetical protein ACFVXI_31565, partial [Kitasatospora herbaricolor]